MVDKASFSATVPMEWEPFTEKIQEEKLRATLEHGVCYLHEGFSSLD
jgi:hypothetical protein